MESNLQQSYLQPYRPRPIRFLERWHCLDWRIKVYGIAFERLAPRPELIAAAKAAAADRLRRVAIDSPNYRLGFLGVHDGKTANFVFLDWWAEENELHHHVYVSPSDRPRDLEYRTPTGLAACVWDLRVMAFERDAWLETVLRNPSGPDFEAYLNRRLNEDA
jgi:hypothetical protein